LQIHGRAALPSATSRTVGVREEPGIIVNDDDTKLLDVL
jgi:hypothetical protein